jgi:hypothetical protein
MYLRVVSLATRSIVVLEVALFAIADNRSCRRHGTWFCIYIQCNTYLNMPMENNREHMILELYKIFDSHRESRLWFLDELDADSYEDYLQKYKGRTTERSHFTAICSFFELSGVFMSRGLLDPDLYFDVFNPGPFWHKAKPIVEGMREKRPFIYENFENLNDRRSKWTKTREK